MPKSKLFGQSIIMKIKDRIVAVLVVVAVVLASPFLLIYSALKGIFFPEAKRKYIESTIEGTGLSAIEILGPVAEDYIFFLRDDEYDASYLAIDKSKKSKYKLVNKQVLDSITYYDVPPELLKYCDYGSVAETNDIGDMAFILYTHDDHFYTVTPSTEKLQQIIDGAKNKHSEK